MSGDWRKLTLLLAGVFLAAMAGCILGCVLTARLSAPAPAIQSRAEDPHAWLHRNLKVTADQETAIASLENQFLAKEKELRSQIVSGNLELAKALREDRSYSPKVEAAIGQIHHAQLELQKLTIEHLIEMGSALTPEQYDRLLELATQALRQE